MELTEKSNKIGKLVYSVIALTLLLMLLITATKAWLSINLSSSVSSTGHYIKIDADSGLNVNYGTEDISEGVIDLDALFSGGQLTPCSSYDGRRIFFPLSDYSTNDAEFRNDFNTTEAVYRESTVNDKNTKYISVDLTLESKGDTEVWLDDTTKIESSNDNKLADAIRFAVIENEPGGNAIVFDNTTSGFTPKGYTPITNLISDGKGVATTTTNAHNISEYKFSNPDKQSLFTLEAGKTKSITVNIWLEGTDPECITAFDAEDMLDILIKFSTSFEETNTFYFVDHTLEKWVDHDSVKLFAIDAEDNRYEMSKISTYTWSVNLPESVTELTFARYNPELQENTPEEWNTWYAGEIGTCHTYNAFGDAAVFADNNGAGIWSEDFSATTISLFDGTQNGGLLSNENNSDGDTTYINLTVLDGNGNEQQIIYKMSYLADKLYWQINIPSNAYCNEDYPIIIMDISEPTSDEYMNYDCPIVFERGDSTYFTITYPGEGYWGNKLIYVNEKFENGNDVLANSAVFSAYFYDSEENNLWTAMRAKTFVQKDGTTTTRYIAAVPAAITPESTEEITNVVINRHKILNGFDAWDWAWENVHNETHPDYQDFTGYNLLIFSGYEEYDGKSRLVGTWYWTTNN